MLTNKKTCVIIISEANKKTILGGIKKMTNYMRFEKQQLVSVQKGLQTASEAMARCTGYLQCMTDMGVITEDRKMEELVNMCIQFAE